MQHTACCVQCLFALWVLLAMVVQRLGRCEVCAGQHSNLLEPVAMTHLLYSVLVFYHVLLCHVLQWMLRLRHSTRCCSATAAWQTPWHVSQQR